jgi:hypothetical protein
MDAAKDIHKEMLPIWAAFTDRIALVDKYCDAVSCSLLPDNVPTFSLFGTESTNKSVPDRWTE